MDEQDTPKAVREKLHETRIVSGPHPGHTVQVYQAVCDTLDCDWHSDPYGDSHNPTTRKYLAENAASEHQRAEANWPGTV
jgi:hypothetical protein